jgi:hypothetical protein
MLVRHHHAGRCSVVEFPEGTRVHRSRLTGMTSHYVPFRGREVPVFDEPGELVVQLAEAGRYGMRLLAIETSDASG